MQREHDPPNLLDSLQYRNQFGFVAIRSGEGGENHPYGRECRSSLADSPQSERWSPGGLHMVTMREVTEWIGTLETHEIDAVMVALQERCDTIHQERSIPVPYIGAVVQITDADPQYLNGLTGEIVHVEDPEHVSLWLDVPSTGALRFMGRNEYTVGAEMRCVLEGVPRSCCYLPSSDAVTA